ncbi:hypothetical protein VTN00DRAFT_6573 [Thermoascus crustaceus]|uniref:uncharacterized protein n=1 Tax=Thermoascus crustaceus TaxID=5088 RepID=UPI00374302D3
MSCSNNLTLVPTPGAGPSTSDPQKTRSAMIYDFNLLIKASWVIRLAISLREGHGSIHRDLGSRGVSETAREMVVE